MNAEVRTKVIEGLRTLPDQLQGLGRIRALSALAEGFPCNERLFEAITLVTRSTQFWVPHHVQRRFCQRFLNTHRNYIIEGKASAERYLRKEVKDLQTLQSLHLKSLAVAKWGLDEPIILGLSVTVRGSPITGDRRKLWSAIAFQATSTIIALGYIGTGKMLRHPIDPSPVLLLQSAAYTAGAYLTGRCKSIDAGLWNALWALFGTVALILGIIAWRYAA